MAVIHLPVHRMCGNCEHFQGRDACLSFESEGYTARPDIFEGPLMVLFEGLCRRSHVYQERVSADYCAEWAHDQGRRGGS